MSEKRNMVIHFMDGTRAVYDFPKQTDDKNSISSHMKKLLEMQYIVIEVEGAMKFYPVANIKSIQVYPLPDTLPDFIIKGAKLVDEY
ncbi:MAG: hypothetical protein ACC653_03175 [Gammaproteobacteria bacterium]